MGQRYSYKRVFARLYPISALSSREPGDWLSLLPEGRLSIRLATAPEAIDIGVGQPASSSVVLAGTSAQAEAVTPNGRCRVEIGTFEHDGVTEFWLIHTDQTSGKFKRTKLITESTGQGHASPHISPRVAVSPGGTFFLADDSGTVRLYDAAQLLNIGTFQVAHAHTDNLIAALAVSADERFVAGLSSWKDIILYNVPERQVVFVRHIEDDTGWYDPASAHILIAGDAEAIATVGVSSDVSRRDNVGCSVNVFQRFPLTSSADLPGR
jgi:WD40 repeat protein